MKHLKLSLLILLGLFLLPEAQAQTDPSTTQTICFGSIKNYRVDWNGTDPLTGTPGSTYAWTLSAAVSGTASITAGQTTNYITVDWGLTSVGSYTDALSVIETNSNGCIGTVVKLTIIIIANPAVPTIITNAATCSSNGTASVSNYNVSNTYTFIPAGPTVGALGVISGLTASTSYTVSASSGSCTSAPSASFSIAPQLITPVVPTISTNAATCSANGTASVSNYSASNTYTFNPTGPTVGALGVISGLTAATGYTVTAGNGSCTSAASISFNIATQLTIPAVPTILTNAATCSSDGTASVSNYNVSNTYTFIPAGPTVGALGVISGLTAGTSYTVTAGNGSCTSAPSASFNIANQLTIPAVPTIVTNAATCSADGTASVSNYGVTLTYTFSPTGPTVGALGVISGLVAGTSYTITAGNGSCTSAPSISFNIATQLTIPAVPTIVTNAATCSANGTASVSNYNATQTYTFNPSGPTVGALGVISSLTAGTSYTVTAGNGSCTSAPSASFNIANQLTTPAVPTIVTNAATCSSDGTASVSNYNGLLIYTFNPSGPSVGALGAISGLTAGTSYTVTAGNVSCTSASSVSINISAQLPTPTITITTPAVCSADLLTWSVGVTVSAGTLTSTAGTVVNTSGNIWTISGIAAGTNITLTSTALGCPGTLSVTAPNCSCPAITAPIAADASYCIGSPIPTFTVTNGPAVGYTLNWYNVATGGSIIGSGTPFTPTTAGTYYAQFVENATSCTSQRTAVELTANALPNVTAGGTATICEGLNTVLTASNAVSYTWSPFATLSSQTGTPVTASPTSNQTYTVIGTDGNGCTNSATVTVTVTPTPTTSPIFHD